MNVIERRRWFHMNPELSCKEFETTQEIKRQLDELSIPNFIPMEAPNVGVLGWIDGKKKGKTVALRADIDALPVREMVDIPFRSKNEGVMHACGHDSHTAMLLTAAEELVKMKDEFDGRIYFLFEPGEEISFGAKYMMRQGDWFKEVESVFGMHIWVPLEKGLVSVDSGPRMAGSMKFTVRIIGRQGHGGEPHTAIDSILCASSAILNLQSIISRNISPFDALTISIGRFEAGTAFNIIPEVAEFEGTVRYYSKDIRDKVEAEMRRVIEGTAKSYGADYDMDFIYQLEPLINNEYASQVARKAAQKIFKEEKIVSHGPTSLSDNFSFYAEEKPSCYAFLGTGNSKCSYPHHSPYFEIDEEVLGNGVRLYINYALEYLK